MYNEYSDTKQSTRLLIKKTRDMVKVMSVWFYTNLGLNAKQFTGKEQCKSVCYTDM